ncbi:hypothetical protein E2C01_015556 [Portunus trituberculatus]|uniref:Uncharacterized protein n=1 Tax=Portunus trituberculatus TaxID=210409 RepID=A0A5B7DN91_PORTR|nr:hypothetical protein [Portunus trituberculatus]
MLMLLSGTAWSVMNNFRFIDRSLPLGSPMLRGFFFTLMFVVRSQLEGSFSFIPRGVVRSSRGKRRLSGRVCGDGWRLCWIRKVPHLD